MRSPQRFCHLVFLAGAILLWNVSSACALDDGFSYDKKIEGKYITAYCAPGLDVPHLVSQLNIRPSDQILAGQSRRPDNLPAGELAPMLDTLFLKVSNILDMHLYSLKTDLKICNTNDELSGIYRRLFNASLGGRRSFYVYDLNSIYVSADAFQPGIIGHEMGHAIIGHYFGIPAPVKVQEVLCMYVEYTLKK
jgi:hypothetical protein